MRFFFGSDLQILCSLSTTRSPDVSFKPLLGMSSSARSAPRSLSNFRAVLVVVESVLAVCVELSPTALWTPLGSKIQVLCAECTLDHRIKSGRFARPHAGDIANRRYSRHSVTFDRSEQINARMCETHSGTEGGGRTARRTRSMICIRSEAMPRCSRPPGNMLCTCEIQRLRFCTSCCQRT